MRFPCGGMKNSAMHRHTESADIILSITYLQLYQKRAVIAGSVFKSAQNTCHLRCFSP